MNADQTRSTLRYALQAALPAATPNADDLDVGVAAACLVAVLGGAAAPPDFQVRKLSSRGTVRVDDLRPDARAVLDHAMVVDPTLTLGVTPYRQALANPTD